MLAVVDRAFLIAVPLLVLSALMWAPSLAYLFGTIGFLATGVTAVCAILGRAGRAPWRGAVYTTMIVASAIAALWWLGPFTGVGVMLGLSVLLAGTLLPRRGLVGVTAVILAAVVTRAMIGGAVGMRHGTSLRVPVDRLVWMGTALGSGILLWVSLRLITALIASLQRSYTEVLDAYRAETVTREQLESSRQELEELAQVEMVGRLAGGVAHDVNNALAAILATAEVLAAEVATPDQRRHLSELEAASHHAADLVRDLLWTGRKFAASTTAEADLALVARGCVERAQRMARTVSVQVMFQHAVKVAMSPEHLEQTLFALVVGAARSGVTRIAIDAARVDDLVEIELTGLAARAIRSGRSRAMQVQLSVSAARELLAQYGATLTVDQTTSIMHVTLRLPIAAGQRDTEPVSAPPRRTALVVEDEPMVRRRLCQLVNRRGYEVTGAATVAEGLARLAAHPDLVITDLQLPDGSGEEVALAAFEQDPRRPIIVCSGFSAADVHRGALRDAVLTFLAKPFTTADLDAALATPAVPRRSRLRTTENIPRIGGTE